MATVTYRLRDFLERSYVTRLEEILRLAEKFEFDTLGKEYTKLKGVEFKTDLESDIQRLLDKYPQIFLGAKTPKIKGYDALIDELKFIERSIELGKMPKMVVYPVKFRLTSYRPILINAKCISLIEQIELLGLKIKDMTFDEEKAFKEELVSELREEFQGIPEVSDRADGITMSMNYGKLSNVAGWILTTKKNGSTNTTTCPIVATSYTYKTLCSLEPNLMSYIDKYSELYNEELEKEDPDFMVLLRYLGFKKISITQYTKKLDFRIELRIAIQDLLDYDFDVLYGIHTPSVNSAYSDYAAVLHRIELCEMSFQKGLKSLDVLLRDSENEEVKQIDGRNFIIALRSVLCMQLQMLYYENLTDARVRIIKNLNRVWDSKSAELIEKEIERLSENSSWKEIYDWMEKYRFSK